MHTVYLLVAHLQLGQILDVSRKYLMNSFNYYT